MTNAVILLVIGLVVWLAHSWRYPWKPCSWCSGNPTNRSRGAFNVRCWWCGSTGRRRRWGARLVGRGYGS